MADTTAIEWTDSTWNPATGCSKVSPGCQNCYAERVANSLTNTPKYANGFKYTEHEDAIDKPTRWKKPRKIFVNSMSDMFHEDADPEFISRCFDVMLTTPRHTYQILTKRSENMKDFLDSMEDPLPAHIWCGVSVESMVQEARIQFLRETNCRTRFVSFEPLLGPMDGDNLDLTDIDWAVIGGESGPNHRMCKYEWVRGLIDICRAAGVPVFFKQWGGYTPKSGGREIDGQTYGEFPVIAHPQQTLG